MLEIKNLNIKSNSGKILIRNFNFNFEKGKTYAIMGPNGAGKSTLLHGIMGSPQFSFGENSQIAFHGKNIIKLKPEQKARQNFFMAFQTPVSLEGINVLELLKSIVGKNIDIINLQDKVNDYAKALKIKPELIHRSLNDKFSGGEKKKMEILQMAILQPEVVMLDEFDTGVDIDSLRIISDFLSKFINKDRIFIIVTHNARILNWLKPDQVLVIQDGHLHRVGDSKLADEIDKIGFEFPCCKICGNSDECEIYQKANH